MSFRRRHRWTRRFLVGLAFGLLVTPAQARVTPNAGFAPDDSARAAVVQHVADPLTDIASRPSVGGALGPDGTGLTTSLEVGSPVRPDDRSGRFTVTGGEVVSVSDDGFVLDSQDGFTLGLGALGAALALWIAAAYLRRPRVAL